MTKKIFALVVAVMMVMALSVTVFANVDLTGELAGALNEQTAIAIPEGVDVSDGAVVKVVIKGTSENTAIRFYLTDGADAGRVTDVAVVDIVDGAFDTTIELAIDFNGGFGGSAEPTVLMIKGPDYATPPANTVFEVLEIVTDGGEEAAAPEADAEEEAPAPEAEEEAPAPAPEAEAETPAPAPAPAPATGLALAVVPAVMALAAVAVSKKH